MSLSVTAYDHTGKKAKNVTLPKEVFGQVQNRTLIAQAIRVFIDHQHQNTNRAKTRGQVSLTTAKVWRQKGTGRARHGARTAPLFVGGGQAHGPVVNKHKPLKLTKKMKRQALLGALSQKATDKAITVAITPNKLANKTKSLVSWLEKTNLNHPRTLFILESPHKNILLAAKNIPNLTITQAKRINTYEVLNARHLIITDSAIESLKATFK